MALYVLRVPVMLEQATKKRLCVSMGAQLYGELKSSGLHEGRTTTAQAEYDLEVMLAVEQSLRYYRLVPKWTTDCGSPEVKLNLTLEPDVYDYLFHEAKGSRVSMSQLVRQRLLYCGEARDKHYPKHPQAILRKEVFIRKIREEWQTRFAKIQ